MMRVQTTVSTGFAAASPSARRATGGTFSVGGNEAARSSAGTSAPRGVGSIDTLLALQAVDEIGERRRRAVRRGRSALDALDALKVSLLAGTIDASALVKLKGAAAEARDASGDPKLDGILAEIELRAEVELAKFERAEASQKRG
jgi:hypothetical protein